MQPTTPCPNSSSPIEFLYGCTGIRDERITQKDTTDAHGGVCVWVTNPLPILPKLYHNDINDIIYTATAFKEIEDNTTLHLPALLMITYYQDNGQSRSRIYEW